MRISSSRPAEPAIADDANSGPARPASGLSSVVRLAGWLALGALTAFLYRDFFFWLYWNTVVGVMEGHCGLVPLLAAGLAWLRRGDAAAPAGREGVPTVRAARTGLTLACWACVFQLLATAADSLMASGLSLVVLVHAAVLGLKGKRASRAMLGPIWFLLFMLPLRYPLEIFLGFPLSLLSARLGEQALRVVGLAVERSGTVLTVPNFTLQVGAPCNGLNLLTGLLMLGAFHAIVSRMRAVAGLLTVATCIPAAVLANALRIAAIAAVGSWWDADLALRWFHDYSGFVSLVLAMGVVVAAGKLFERLPAVAGPAGEGRGEPVAARGNGSVHLLNFCLLLAMAALPDWAIARGRQTVSPPPLASFPAEVGGLGSVAEPLTADELNLEATTGGEILRRAYSRDRRTVWVALVSAGASWRVHHPPEFCYVAQGWTVLENRQTADAGGQDYRELLVEHAGDRRVVQYWFTDGELTTASALARWLAALEAGFQGRRRYPWLLVIQSSRAHDVESLDRFRAPLRQAARGWLAAWPGDGVP